MTTAHQWVITVMDGAAKVHSRPHRGIHTEIQGIPDKLDKHDKPDNIGSLLVPTGITLLQSMFARSWIHSPAWHWGIPLRPRGQTSHLL